MSIKQNASIANTADVLDTAQNLIRSLEYFEAALRTSQQVAVHGQIAGI